MSHGVELQIGCLRDALLNFMIPDGESWTARAHHSLSPGYPAMTINVSSFIAEEIPLTHLNFSGDLPSPFGHYSYGLEQAN